MNTSSPVISVENIDDCGIHQVVFGIEQATPEWLALRTQRVTTGEAPAKPVGTFKAAAMAKQLNDVCLTADDLQMQKAGKPVKHPVSPEIKQQIIELRRRHSLTDVAQYTGLPLGTAKTICSRSGAFRDNRLHRALFSLPPTHESRLTLPAVLELPPKQRVTGDKEIDAVLWLRQVIGTGQAALIDKAMEAAKKIQTPLDQLEKRYRDWVASNQPGSLFAVLSSFDFASLEGLAKSSVKKAALLHEARSRFGYDLFAEMPAEASSLSL